MVCGDRGGRIDSFFLRFLFNLILKRSCFWKFNTPERVSVLFQLAAILVLLSLVQIIISGLSFAASTNDGNLTQARQKIADNLGRYGNDAKYRLVQEHIEEKVMF